MRKPRTEAGRRLLGWLNVIDAGGLPPPIATAGAAILAIEDEARADLIDRLVAQAEHDAAFVERASSLTPVRRSVMIAMLRGHAVSLREMR